jgi:hypothetical protein
MVPRHDDDREKSHENRKAFWGFGRRARLKVNGRTIRTEPRLMKVRGFFYCLKTSTKHHPEGEQSV